MPPPRSLGLDAYPSADSGQRIADSGIRESSDRDVPKLTLARCAGVAQW